MMLLQNDPYHMLNALIVSYLILIFFTGIMKPLLLMFDMLQDLLMQYDIKGLE